MFLLTLRDSKEEGAYAVQNRYGEKVLFLFEDEEDAERYAMHLEEDEEASMDVVEVDDNLAILTCKRYNYKYAVANTYRFSIYIFYTYLSFSIRS
jgi:hypothetical protein